jgi:hypothetical protein
VHRHDERPLLDLMDTDDIGRCRERDQAASVRIRDLDT